MLFERSYGGIQKAQKPVAVFGTCTLNTSKLKNMACGKCQCLFLKTIRYISVAFFATEIPSVVIIME